MFASRVFRGACWLVLGSPLLFPRADGASSATAYLQSVSDRCQSTVDVYTIADGACNHFAARGEFDSHSADVVPAMDEISPSAPCLDFTCITAKFDPSLAAWGGWYFMNGVLGATDRVPAPNWGNTPDAGYDLTGATQLQFWARGAQGGEKILFFMGGVGWDPDANTIVAPYPDSAPRTSVGPITLTTTWTQYTIALPPNLDLHYVLGGFGWVAAATDQPTSQPITFYLGRIQYAKARPTDPRLIVSYETIKSLNPGHDFDSVLRNAAFVYDNALALISFLVSGDLARTHFTADALLYGQQHDRFFFGPNLDGRIRNAYQGGDISLPPGWLPNNQPNTVRMPGWYDAGRQTWFEDETQVSTNTGNVAWAGLALLNLWEIMKEPKYLTAAQTLGTWVIDNASDQPERGQGGFTGGYDGWENGAVSGAAAGTCASGVFVHGQCKRLYKSTEHNIDLYSMFSRLYLADGSPTWAAAAQNAKHFFLSMWDPQGGKFWTGTKEDGTTVSEDVVPVDIQAWSILALGPESQPYQSALGYVETHHKTALGYGFKQDGGNSCGDNTWFEGTSQVADAYLLIGDQAKWQSILNTEKSAQLQSGAMPATDGQCLNTGFTLNDGLPWLYYPRAHVGATAWRALAEQGVDPYRPSLYSPALNVPQLAFGAQNISASSAAQIVTLSNPGALPLAVSNVALTGSNAADFVQHNNCIGSLPARGTCGVSVTFTPQAEGLRSGSLIITETSDSAMQPVAFVAQMNGVGVPQGTYTLTLQVSPVGSGTIVATPSSATGAYAAGAQVCFKAVPAASWSFSSWAGDLLDSNGCLIMSAARSVIAKFVQSSALRFVPVTPCRVADTRNVDGPLGGPRLGAQASRDFAIPNSSCNIPATAKAYSMNVAVVPARQLGYITVWPAGTPQPLVATLSSLDGRIKSNALIVSAGTSGAISVFVTDDSDVVLDINGYFIADSQATGLDYYPLSPCRIVDTRNPAGPLAGPFLAAGSIRSFPVLSSACNIPADAQAYVLNFAAVPRGTLGYLTAWPAGQTQPLAATLNAVTGTVTANAAIVPAGVGGAIDVFATNDTDLVIDLNGYFALPRSGGLTLYNLTPCRVLDSRQPLGAQPLSGVFNLNVSENPCGIPDNARAFIFNATVVPEDTLGYITMWPHGLVQPLTATLNAVDGAITSNMAIVSSTDGYVSIFSTNPTFLVLDAFGYLAVDQSSSETPPLVSSINSISPTSGASTGGTVVTISGINFQNGAKVLFGQTPATSVAFQNSNDLQVTSPAGTGTVNVTVINPGGQAATLSSAFTYQTSFPPPAVNGIAPTSGASTGGTVVTISGINFQNGAVVRFGQTPGTSLVFLSSSTLQVTSPQGTGIVNVTVINPDGQAATLSNGFTYQSSTGPPAVSSVAPNIGATGGGTTVTITGTGFQNGATVTFGGVSATSVIFISAASLQVTTPPGSPGTVDVTVTIPDGQSATSKAAFQYATASCNGCTVQAQVVGCTINGSVTGATLPDAFKIVIYAYTNMYYIQPCDTEPTQPISQNGTWGPIDSHNGNIFVLLVSSEYSPELTLTTLPSVDGVNVLALTGSVGAISGCDVSRCPAQ